jgi:hypothetical protein
VRILDYSSSSFVTLLLPAVAVDCALVCHRRRLGPPVQRDEAAAPRPRCGSGVFRSGASTDTASASRVAAIEAMPVSSLRTHQQPPLHPIVFIPSVCMVCCRGCCVQVQCLSGDRVDGIPGVPGVGLKTAARLINEYGSFEAVVACAKAGGCVGRHPSFRLLSVAVRELELGVWPG